MANQNEGLGAVVGQGMLTLFAAWARSGGKVGQRQSQNTKPTATDRSVRSTQGLTRKQLGEIAEAEFVAKARIRCALTDSFRYM